jgi:hypothetical protein
MCDGTVNGNAVGVDQAVTWSSSDRTWDLGDHGGAALTFGSTFHYASETFDGQPCSSGCTIQIPAISQRVQYRPSPFPDDVDSVSGCFTRSTRPRYRHDLADHRCD